ncbi:alpha/beta fold hydrolase [Limibacillus sp. MBR-115]|jgi:phospholipase/carboxylesterase|uniref:alpha/beta hydrolase n=1 Tax=Limibacillus sp. MBR-115 TaxID=3156465 RepID=UPI0033996BE5
MALMELDGPRAEPASGGPAKSLVIFLHGLGADGNDLIGLAPLLSQVLPDTAFVSPNAPEPCDMAPSGYQWFSLQDRSSGQVLSGVQVAAPQLEAFIAREAEHYGLSLGSVALVGFSQGTMMSLYVAPRLAETVAGVVGYSGALVAPERLPQEIKVRPPILLIHGDADPVVPSAALTAATQALLSMQFKVMSDLRPGLGHSIDEEGLSLGAAFLRQVLVEGGLPEKP